MQNWVINYQPREWQITALNRWLVDLRGVVSVVTGGGKTFFAQLCILEFLKKYSHGRIIIIVPTISLLDQWNISLQEDLGILKSLISNYSGDEKPDNPNTFNIAVINTARRIAPHLSENHDSFLIVDECHRAGSSINSLALNGHHQATLGLSATPQREYDDGFNKYIVPSLGEIIFEYSYEDAYRDNVITPFELVNVRVSLLPDEQDKYDRLSKTIAIELNKLKADEGSLNRLKLLLQRRAL